MTRQRLFHSPRSPLPLLAGLALWLAACGGALPAPRHAGAEPVLAAGSRVEREIAGGAVDTYRLPLAAGQYVRLRIAAGGPGIRARLLAPGGEEVAVAAERGGDPRRGALSWIAGLTGEHRLTVAARDAAAPAGRYWIAVEALRPAAAGDADRVAADRAFAAARLALSEQTAAAKERARRSFAEALAAWGRAGGAGDVAGRVDALLQLVEIDSDQADFAAAARRCDEALAAAEAAGDEAGIAAALAKQGDLALQRSDLDRALEAYEQALPLWKALGNPAGEAATLNGIGQTLGLQGRQEEAWASYESALPLRRQAGDLNGEALTLTAMAGLRLARGDLREGLDDLERALALGRAAGDLRTESAVLFNIGVAHRLRGELEAALASFEEVLGLHRRLGDRESEPNTLHAIGSLYSDLGDPAKALARYQEALGLCQGALCEARELSSISFIQHRSGDAEVALATAGRALARSREAGNAQREASAQYALGQALNALGRREEARAAFSESLRLRQAGGSVLDQAFALLALANVRRDLGDTAGAEEGYRQTLDLAQPVGIPVIEAQCLYHWALLDRRAGRLAAALDKVSRAVDAIESVLSRVTAESLRTSYFASRREVYELWVDLLMDLDRQSPGEGRAAALAASERARARALLDLLAEARIDVEQGVDPALKARETDLESRLSFFQDRLFRAEPAKRAPLQEAIGRLEEELDRLEAEIRRSDPRYAQVRYPAPLSLAGIQALLDDDTAFLEYFVGRAESHLFVVTRSGLATYPLPGQEALEKAVRRVREAMQQKGVVRKGDYADQASRLYALLVAPAAEALAGRSRLLIAPDGPLHLLPFEALLTEPPRSMVPFSGLPYLLDRYAVSYVPSASVLAGLREPRAPLPSPSARPDLVAFADPVVEAGAGEPPLGIRWTRLTGSEGEVRTIGSLYPPAGVRIYVREEATEERVKSDPSLAAARRLHFATHGFVTEPPLSLSGLVLTRAPGSRENGVLEVREIFNLRLSADLVTLSACETGLGREVSGEGVVGMTRAFFYAGARSLLVSFWNASDASTPRLMEGFYRHLGEPGGKAEALRRAKLDLIANKTYSEPYYWAPFLLSGDLR